MTTVLRWPLLFFPPQHYRLYLMGTRRLTLLVGGERSSPANRVAETFTPQFPGPSPLAVFSRLLMELGRAMGVLPLRPLRCRPVSRSKRLSLITSSGETPAFPTGMPPEAVGLVEVKASPFRKLRLFQSPAQSRVIIPFPQRPNPNLDRMWHRSHLHEDTGFTWFGEENPSLGSQDLIGGQRGHSIRGSSKTPTGSTQGNDWFFPSPKALSNESKDSSQEDNSRAVRGTFCSFGHSHPGTRGTYSRVRQFHPHTYPQSFWLVVDNFGRVGYRGNVS